MEKTFRRSVPINHLNMREECKRECIKLKRDCDINSEAHHILALNAKTKTIFSQAIPATLATFSAGVLLDGTLPTWLNEEALRLTLVISSVITALSGIFSPSGDYYEQLRAAKHFGILKHEARLLCNLLHTSMSEEELLREVKHLREKYKTLVLFAPPTNNRAFKKAKRNVDKEKSWIAKVFFRNSHPPQTPSV